MDQSTPISVVVVTPERQVVEEMAAEVILPAHDGEIGILKDRAALMCELGIGVLRYKQAAVTHRVFIDGGFAQVVANRVTVLTNRAVPVEQITKDMLAAAEKTLTEQHGFDAEVHTARERVQRRLSVLRSLSPGRP